MRRGEGRGGEGRGGEGRGGELYMPRIKVDEFWFVLGVESGSNYSGDLRDAQKSIPLGTVAAVIVTSTICILSEKLSSVLYSRSDESYK